MKIAIPKNKEKKKYPCIWMQAGVVRKKECTREYNCYECPFDRAMVRASQQNSRFKHWKDALLELSPNFRPCIHTMKKRIKFRRCTNKYRCSSCEFNQYFEDTFWIETLITPINMLKVWGISIPQGFYLHPSHLWVRLQGSSEALIGLDEFVKKIFGPLHKIRVPLMGKRVRKDKKHITIKKDSLIAKIPFPLSGIILEVNPRVWENKPWEPSSCYEEWLLKIRSTNLSEEIKGLMIDEESKDFMEKEINLLTEHIEEVYGPLCVDGGEISGNLYEKMPHLNWKKLIKDFFKTS